jgi:DNA topoisomerase II
MADSDSDDCFMMVDSDSVDEASEDDFSSEDEENVIPKTKAKAAPVKVAPKKTKAPAKKTTAVAENVLGTMTNTGPSPSKKKAAPMKEKTVEERYQKKSQIEHILIRPDTYSTFLFASFVVLFHGWFADTCFLRLTQQQSPVGSTQPLTTNMYVLNEQGRIVEKEITYTPGLYKIFDEIVVNAADNKQRDPMMDKLDIVVDAEKNVISVRNNGKGIPVVIHKEHQVYVPTMIFGHLLTGSNFDDDEQKTTGGRNGYGAKLANVFSKEFVVDCVDVEHGVTFHQVFRNNMSVAEEPVVRSCSAAERKAGDSVQITFSPDLERFKMDHLDEATVGLFARRAYDIAGTMAGSAGKRLQVTLNGQKLLIKSFKEYIGTFDNVTAPVAYAQNDRWEVCVGASNDASMQQISFVNAIHTSNGGKHVMYIADQIAAHLIKALKKKSKGGSELKKAQIINHLFIMINCLIENPSFDSQSKDRLNSQPKTFGSKFELSPEFLKKIEKSDIAEKILSYATFKDREALKRKGGVKKIKLTGIAKLDDANFAGGARSTQCTLIICEGDSAKSLAMAGLSVVGRDFYGVFPLKGKPMNVRDAKTSAVNKNEEIENLVKIMGLKYGTKYDETNIKTLRYGHLMIMADQDSDGSHIKGLIVNLIHSKYCHFAQVNR